jgi:hypothetical protein
MSQVTLWFRPVVSLRIELHFGWGLSYLSPPPQTETCACDFFIFRCGSRPESSQEHLPTSIAGVLRLRAIKPSVCDRSAKRFAQDDGFVGGLEIQLVGYAEKHEKIERVTGSQDGPFGNALPPSAHRTVWAPARPGSAQHRQIPNRTKAAQRRRESTCR